MLRNQEGMLESQEATGATLDNIEEILDQRLPDSG